MSTWNSFPTGVPRAKRGDIWHFLAVQFCLKQPPYDSSGFPNYDVCYEELLKQLTSFQHAILIDLGRTFPNHPYFASPLGPGQLALFNLLKAYSLLDPQVGYCQGLSFVAGVLLLHVSFRMRKPSFSSRLCFIKVSLVFSCPRKPLFCCCGIWCSDEDWGDSTCLIWQHCRCNCTNCLDCCTTLFPNCMRTLTGTRLRRLCMLLLGYSLCLLVSFHLVSSPGFLVSMQIYFLFLSVLWHIL